MDFPRECLHPHPPPKPNALLCAIIDEQPMANANKGSERGENIVWIGFCFLLPSSLSFAATAVRLTAADECEPAQFRSAFLSKEGGLDKAS